MPVLKSAKKRMRQNIKRRNRNFPLRSELKTYVKKVLTLVKEGKYDEAEKALPRAFSVIDTAVKKHIIHQNNGDRKKSRLARALNLGKSGKGAEKKVEVKGEKKKDVSKKDKAEK